MVDYPYDESDAAIDRSTFDVFAKYFELRDDFRELYGYNIFIYDEEWMKQLPALELMRVAPYVLTYRELAFDSGFRVRSENISRSIPDTKEFIELMRCRGITRESFLENMMTFQFSEAGGESTQFISGIATDLEGSDSFLESGGKGMWIDICRKRYLETKEKCAVENKGREKLFSLEHVLKFKAKPVAIDYASNGRLYVFDESGMLHEFIDGLKSEEWQIRYRAGSFQDGIMSNIFSPIFPNISVEGNTLFLTNGPQLERYDLEQKKIYRREMVKYTGNSLALRQGEKVRPSDVWFHDVCLKEGNVFVSVSLRTDERYILQIDGAGGHTRLYTGLFPREFGLSNNYQDLTLRLGFFHGGLYFPEQNGISRLSPDGPVEMLGDYTREINKHLLDIDPITKFAFGHNFLVASGRVKDFEMPMMQVFRPVYPMGERGLVVSSEMVQPTHFERVYIAPIPLQTGRMIKQLSLSACGDSFAMTHYDFERVLLYKMNGE